MSSENTPFSHWFPLVVRLPHVLFERFSVAASSWLNVDAFGEGHEGDPKFSTAPLVVICLVTTAIVLFCRFQTQSNKNVTSQQKQKKKKKGDSHPVDSDATLPPVGPSFFDLDTRGQAGRDFRGEPIVITENTKLFSSWVQKYGKVFRMASPLPGLIPDLVFVSDATAAKELLVKHNNLYRDNYAVGRDTAFCSKIQAAFGYSIASVSDMLGEWKWRRDALLREFHKSRLVLDHKRQFLERVIASGQRMCEELAVAADKGEAVPIHVLTVKATASIIFFFLFGRDLEFDVFDFYGGAVYLLAHLSHLAMCPYHDWAKNIPGTKCHEAETRKVAAWKAMDGVYEKEVQLMLREHLGEVPVAANRQPGSALASLLQSEPKFASLGLHVLMQEIRTIVVAGFENTSNSLAFAMGILAERPDIGDRIAAEARTLMAQQQQGGTNLATFVPPANVARLEDATTSKNLFMETVRLYPLVPSLTSKVQRDLTFTTSKGTKYKLRKGTVLMNLPFDVQRDEENLGTVGHSNPLVVDPDRWNVPIAEQPFLSGFSLGAHVCPGKTLSILEGHVILLMVAARFTFHDADSKEEEEENETRGKTAGITSDDLPETNIEFYDVSVARPKGGLVRLVKRRKT